MGQGGVMRNVIYAIALSMTCCSSKLRAVLGSTQDVHDGGVRRGHVDSGIPGIWRRVGGHGGADLVTVSRRGEQLAAVGVTGVVAAWRCAGPADDDQLARAGMRKRARTVACAAPGRCRSDRPGHRVRAGAGVAQGTNAVRRPAGSAALSSTTKRGAFKAARLGWR